MSVFYDHWMSPKEVILDACVLYHFWEKNQTVIVQWTLGWSSQVIFVLHACR